MIATTRIAWALHAALAVGLAFVPLFDGLGFERALSTGLLSTLTSPWVTIGIIRRSQRDGLELGLAPAAKTAVLLNLAMLLPSIGVGVVVELVRQPCEPDAGLLFMALIAGGNAVFGTALGAAASLVVFRAWMPTATVIAVLVVALGAVVLRFYSHPQIFVYSAPWGYWPGSLYDEALAVDARLWAFRGYSTALAATVLATALAFSDPRIRPTYKPRLVPLLAAVILAGTTVWAAVKGVDVGWNLDRGAVQSVLRTRVETDHFILHVDPSVSAERLRRIVEDHEHRYQQLIKFFEAEPTGKVVSFVYRNPQQKARLMGALNTQIARPWAREIHIDGFNVPHRVLKHELAHIFAGAKARGPLKVPAFAGLLVNIGIVEGIAVAADWPVRELTVHGWTRAMKGLGLMPDLTKSLDLFGFWSISSSRAYTVAGSFLRYLVDTYGIDKFWVLYASNSFERAYERPLEELVAEWETFLDTVPLPKDDLVVAEHRFKRPSIFEKVCAHVSANYAARGYERLYAGDLDGAREDLERIYRYAPGNPYPLIALANGYARAGEYERAQSLIARAYASPGATLKGQTRAVEARANLAWRKQDFAGAREDYELVRERHLSTPSDRLQQARLLALTRTATPPTELDALLATVLLGDGSQVENLVRLAEASFSLPDDALVQYLYARALENQGAWALGVEPAERSALGLSEDPLQTEARLTYGRLLWWSGRFGEAAHVFERVAETHPAPAIIATATDWADRARFSRGFRWSPSRAE